MGCGGRRIDVGRAGGGHSGRMIGGGHSGRIIGAGCGRLRSRRWKVIME